MYFALLKIDKPSNRLFMLLLLVFDDEVVSVFVNNLDKLIESLLRGLQNALNCYSPPFLVWVKIEMECFEEAKLIFLGLRVDKAISFAV